MTSIPIQTARAWADVNLGAVLANAQAVATISGARLLPMVKANGYGVGAVAVCRALERLDPWGYGVATAEEGIALRLAGITRPIVVFTPLRPASIGQHLAHSLRPVIGDRESLRLWLTAGQGPFHIEIDTGMSRTGFRWDTSSDWRESLTNAPGWEGVFTHFHSAEENPASVNQQWERFGGLLGLLPVRPPLVHAASSSTALLGKTYACDLVRPGIFLYGGDAGAFTAESVVKLRATVVALREIGAGDSVSYGATWRAAERTRVATLAIGYADGVLRSLCPEGVVELGGRVVPMLGRVSMDFVMVAAFPHTALGDTATIFGGLVSLNEQARRAGTISYELLTAMGPRVERRYA